MIATSLYPAAISNSRIEDMDPEDLVRLILSFDLPLPAGELNSRLTYDDRPTLQRLAWQATRWHQRPAVVTDYLAIAPVESHG